MTSTREPEDQNTPSSAEDNSVEARRAKHVAEKEALQARMNEAQGGPGVSPTEQDTDDK